MGKARKKPKGKGEKNRRFARWSNAALKPVVNSSGSGHKAPSGLMQVGVAEYRNRAASIGKPEALPRDKAERLIINERLIRNEASLAYMREVWIGSRRQGITDFYCEVVKEIKFTYRLALLFSGRRFIWMCEDWRTEKRQFSIVYSSRERAFQVKDSERGITWYLEDALNASERYA